MCQNDKGCKGVKCERCGSRRSKVVYVKNLNRTILRNRQCVDCGYRFRTREVAIEE